MLNEKEPVSFLKKLARTGTSFTVIIPKNVLDYFELGEGDLIYVTVKKPAEEPTPKELLLPYKKHIPAFTNFSLNDINSCLFFASLENSLLEGLSGNEYNKSLKRFEDKIKYQKGGDFLNKYRTFKESIKDKEVMLKIVKESMSASAKFKKSMKISSGKKVK